MLGVVLKTFAATTIAFAGFMLMPMAFPLTMLTVVLIFALPLAIGAWRYTPRIRS